MTAEAPDPQPLWVVERAAPRWATWLLWAAVLACAVMWLLGLAFVRRAEEAGHALGPAGPGGPGAMLSLMGGLLAAQLTLLGSVAVWIDRRHGRCDAFEEHLVFTSLRTVLAVRRADVTGWDEGPHGLLVHATTHVPAGGRDERRGRLQELLFPLLIPASTPAELGCAVAYLRGRP